MPKPKIYNTQTTIQLSQLTRDQIDEIAARLKYPKVQYNSKTIAFCVDAVFAVLFEERETKLNDVLQEKIKPE